ncbi:protein C12orf4 homolog [Dendronephthya gigantea]|uniref:protein C12orf4 homolog n=1 Tax=Dendronephthya gigantea TaxID=151771 RepID=UPI00106BD728|nr:protein C12orf4 homolog [Dendronephthya gigantea]
MNDNAIRMSGLTKEFSFEFVNEDKLCKFLTNVTIPADVSKVNELTKRIVNYHNLPAYLEEDLLNCLTLFMRKENNAFFDDQADEILEICTHNAKQAEIAIDSWNEAFTQECSKYSDAKEVKTEELTFSEMYHLLIHSASLETLLQLENTYALAVQDMLAQRDAALDKLEQKQNKEMKEALEPGVAGINSDNYHESVNNLAARHCEDTQMISTQWSSALSDLQEVQKREYQEWVGKVHEDLVQTSSKDPGGSFESFRSRSASTVSLLPDEVHNQMLEESFTIHLGAQMKSTHNLRLMCCDLLDLCRYKPAKQGTSIWAQPQRIQTAMSLYSQSLSGLVLLVDNRINSYTGIKKEFASICQQSTDFHFPDLDKQFCMIQQNLEERRQKKMQISGAIDARNDEAFKTSTMETGNFYITRHSNLSQVHVVFHLVVDDSLKSPTLAARNAIVSGLRNVLHTASRQNIHTITLPVLLAEEMTEDMTVTWCTRRAELVLKCVKGFMMECASWSGSESFNIQFVLPKDISSDMFHTLSNMLPSIFRVSRTLDLQDLSRK